MSNQAYIFDAVRTPRSKGKKDGSLHEVRPIELPAGLLRELQSRHDLDTSYVDDVLLGCVTPTSEQGSDIAKASVQQAGWDESVAGVQLDRFCASGLEAVNTAAQKVMSGWSEMVVAGGVESMSEYGATRLALSDVGSRPGAPEFVRMRPVCPKEEAQPQHHHGSAPRPIRQTILSVAASAYASTLNGAMPREALNERRTC